MTIHYRNDSDRVTHQVWAQRQANSCAVASIWMARNQARQMTMQEGEWARAWSLYHRVVLRMDIVPEPPAPMSLNPDSHDENQSAFSNMFASYGTYMGQVNEGLRNDGLSVTFTTTFSPGTTISPKRLSDTTPAIVLLGWYQQKVRRGGHFIVASRVTGSGNIVYLDPWGGQLREMGIGPNYLANGRFEQISYISA